MTKNLRANHKEEVYLVKLSFFQLIYMQMNLALLLLLYKKKSISSQRRSRLICSKTEISSLTSRISEQNELVCLNPKTGGKLRGRGFGWNNTMTYNTKFACFLAKRWTDVKFFSDLHSDLFFSTLTGERKNFQN